MVETAAAFFRIAEIARAHPRLCALNLGAEDFATSAGILPEAEALSMPKQMAVFAARAAGIMPLGFIGSIAEFHDLDGFRQTIRRSRRFGFIGASVIHPSQVPILNEEFRPSAADRLFALKRRPRTVDLPLLVASADQVPTVATAVPQVAELLMARFWPGPLTLVLPRRDVVPDLVTAGQATVALRMSKMRRASSFTTRSTSSGARPATSSAILAALTAYSG